MGYYNIQSRNREGLINRLEKVDTFAILSCFFNPKDITLKGVIVKKIIPLPINPPVCFCGCGRRVKQNPHNLHRWNHYIHGRQPVTTARRENARKQGLANKGKIHTEQQRLDAAKLRIGSHRNDETKKRMSIARSKWHESHPGARNGAGNPNWAGGLSWEIYPQEWTEELREQIRLRDSYTCQLPSCKNTHTNRKLIVHHIDYNKRNCAAENLIALCISCHTRTSNTHRSRWQKMFTKLMRIKNEL